MTAISQAAFNTKHEAGFSQSALPALDALNVHVADIRHDINAGELHVTLVLPSHDRGVRAAALQILDEFEASYGFAVTVSPALLVADDPALN